MHDRIFEFITPTFNYTEDNILSDRVCPYKTVNSYGLMLIQMCIETDLQILNDRDGEYIANDFTYCGANGRTVIDYV